MTVPAADALRYDGTTRVPLVSDLAVAADLLDAIDALHRKVIHLTTGDITICPTCDENTYGAWPCDTARLLHPAPKEDK